MKRVGANGNGSTIKHISRYDILMTKLNIVPYRPLPLLPNGRSSTEGCQNPLIPVSADDQ